MIKLSSQYSSRLLSGRHVIVPYIFEIHRANGRATVQPCTGRARAQRNYWSTAGVIAVIAPPETDRSSNYSKAFSILVTLLAHEDGGCLEGNATTFLVPREYWRRNTKRRGEGGRVRGGRRGEGGPFIPKRSCPFAAIQRTWAVDSLCAKFPGISILC